MAKSKNKKQKIGVGDIVLVTLSIADPRATFTREEKGESQTYGWADIVTRPAVVIKVLKQGGKQPDLNLQVLGIEGLPVLMASPYGSSINQWRQKDR